MDAKRETKAIIENLMTVNSFMEEFKQNNFENYEKCLNALIEMTVNNLMYANSFESPEVEVSRGIEIPSFVKGER